MPFSLIALATLRARQGDDAAADGLYQEAIGCSANPWLSADAMVGQSAAARRLGDLARARALLDTAGSRYRQLDFPAGPPRVLAGLAWWALAAGRLGDTTVFAADAVEGASASGDPATRLLADTAVAAVKVVAEPTRGNTDAFVALTQRPAVHADPAFGLAVADLDAITGTASQDPRNPRHIARRDQAMTTPATVSARDQERPVAHRRTAVVVGVPS